MTGFQRTVNKFCPLGVWLADCGALVTAVHVLKLNSTGDVVMFAKEVPSIPKNMITETEQKGDYLENVIENCPEVQRKLNEMHAEAKALVAEMKERGMDGEIIEYVENMSDGFYDLVAVFIEDIFLNPEAADVSWKIAKVNQYGSRVLVKQLNILLKYQQKCGKDENWVSDEDSL